MTRLQSTLLVASALGISLLAACGGSSTSTPPTVARQLAISYTAIGASDAVGYGASVPCTVASPALVADPTCPERGASGYVPDIRTGFAQHGFVVARLQDLGISGAVIGPDIEALGDQYSSTCAPRAAGNQIPGNFLQNELPKVDSSALFVTIFAGGNDVNTILTALSCGAGGATAQSQTAFVTQEITAFGHDFAQLVGGVHQAAPNATIVVANIPNFANVPYAFAISSNAAVDGAARTALQQISVAIDTNVIDTIVAQGLTVVDLQCDPASYAPANFYTDGFHPNDSGYALLAGKFLTQALVTPAALPQSSCAYQGLASAPGLTPSASAIRTSVFIPAGERFAMPRG